MPASMRSNFIGSLECQKLQFLLILMAHAYYGFNIKPMAANNFNFTI